MPRSSSTTGRNRIDDPSITLLWLLVVAPVSLSRRLRRRAYPMTR
jgi:hypothetical protein